MALTVQRQSARPVVESAEPVRAPAVAPGRLRSRRCWSGRRRNRPRRRAVIGRCCRVGSWLGAGEPLLQLLELLIERLGPRAQMQDLCDQCADAAPKKKRRSSAGSRPRPRRTGSPGRRSLLWRRLVFLSACAHPLRCAHLIRPCRCPCGPSTAAPVRAAARAPLSPAAMAPAVRAARAFRRPGRAMPRTRPD